MMSNSAQRNTVENMSGDELIRSIASRDYCGVRQENTLIIMKTLIPLVSSVPPDNKVLNVEDISLDHCRFKP